VAYHLGQYESRSFCSTVVHLVPEVSCAPAQTPAASPPQGTSPEETFPCQCSFHARIRSPHLQSTPSNRGGTAPHAARGTRSPGIGPGPPARCAPREPPSEPRPRASSCFGAVPAPPLRRRHPNN